MSEWQPIETAPKDGTRIIAYAPNHPDCGPIVRTTWWRQQKKGHSYDGWGEFNTEYWPPTHWMPPPEPRAAGASERHENATSYQVLPKRNGSKDLDGVLAPDKCQRCD